jgi:alpha/beta superfamily hydrolase
MTTRSERFKLSVAGLQLEALWTGGFDAKASAVLAPPHPVYGGTLSNPVLVAAADSFTRSRIAALRFNYRGTDDSEGTATDSLEAAVEDYGAAFTELRARAAGPYLLAGYSFGAGTALLVAQSDARVAGLVLLAPPVGMLRSEDLSAFTGKLLVVVGDDDDYAPLPALKEQLAAKPDTILEVIPGADHFFHYGGLSALGERIEAHVKTWF